LGEGAKNLTKNLEIGGFHVLLLFMPLDAEADIAEDRHGRILAELAGLSLALARDLQNRALEAETPEQAARLAAAFQGVARGVRQTLALELKVADFRRKLEIQAAQDKAAGELRGLPDDAAVLTAALDRQTRREEIEAVVSDLIWNEYERGEDESAPPSPHVEALYRALDRVLDVAERRADFVTADVRDQIIVACTALGLDPRPLDHRADAKTPEPADTG
jgi:hypothetical protein